MAGNIEWGEETVAYSYASQLRWLMKQIEMEQKVGRTGFSADLQMLLSLAQSVKEARGHNLNCPKEKL